MARRRSVGTALAGVEVPGPMAEDRGARAVVRNPLAREPAGKIGQAVVLQILREQGRSVEQRDVQLRVRLRRARRAEHGHAVLDADPQDVRVPPDLMEEAEVAVGHSLRAPGRSGRVEDVGEGVGGQAPAPDPPPRPRRRSSRRSRTSDGRRVRRPARASHAALERTSGGRQSASTLASRASGNEGSSGTQIFPALASASTEAICGALRSMSTAIGSEPSPRRSSTAPLIRLAARLSSS